MSMFLKCVFLLQFPHIQLVISKIKKSEKKSDQNKHYMRSSLLPLEQLKWIAEGIIPHFDNWQNRTKTENVVDLKRFQKNLAGYQMAKAATNQYS